MAKIDRANVVLTTVALLTSLGMGKETIDAVVNVLNGDDERKSTIANEHWKDASGIVWQKDRDEAVDIAEWAPEIALLPDLARAVIEGPLMELSETECSVLRRMGVLKGMKRG